MELELKKMKYLVIFSAEVFQVKSFFDHLVECTRIRLDNNQNKLMVLLT